ncbi:hypothetical protein F5Y04DRAFT_83314 [Hypomontagnella monticulosa]|nr:hypothetical protein F5Y04DRAFT_83314 [Hypomontagnella monticulosa]
MQVLPFVQVKDLPPSSSFYAAIAQPLGLKYISASPSSIVFGDSNSPSPETVFEVKQNASADFQPLKPCRLVLSAKSPSVVSAFHAAALRAYPELKHGDANVNFLQLHSSSESSGESRARIGDLDGNIMEVVHNNRSDYAPSQAGSAVRHSHSSTQEASRVLDWNLDVGTTAVPSRSVAGSVAPASTVGTRTANGEPYSWLRRSVTTSTVETSPRENSKGLSTSAVVGTVLGVAVGAAVGGALTYSMMKNEQRDRMAFQGYEASPSYQQPRYYPPTTYVGGYSQVGGPKSRVVEELDDRSSRHSSQYTTGSRARGRSEVTATRRPLMLTETEHRSNAGSKHSEAPKLLMDAEHRSAAGSKHTAADSRSQAGSRHTAAPSRHSPDADYRSYAGSKHTTSRPRDADAGTYVSASTIRPGPPHPTAETVPPSRAQSRAPSRYSSATVKAPATNRAPSRAPTHATARHVPESHAGWGDDTGTVAPSDSISNIGYRYSTRSQRA